MNRGRTTLLAVTPVHPGISIPAAAMLAAWIAWYWRRLGRSDVAEGRRRIRRISMMIMFVALPATVRAVSFVKEQAQTDFVLAWSIVMVLVLLMALTAMFDLWYSMRQHREQAEREALESGAKLQEALRAARQGAAPPPDGNSAT